ncbi:polygalacturonase-like [Daucus carota subsp. sativus]|uniref:polygalacturonase-like n=1 Tax=Daucus carota subsp. sativus TaxID=79200 RepID=UPI003082D35A
MFTVSKLTGYHTGLSASLQREQNNKWIRIEVKKQGDLLGIDLCIISHCNIGTGDDCISIGGGSKKLRINDIICGPGHGISVGSLGKHGDYDDVDDVEIIGAVFTGTTNGARIKTWQGGKGYARNIRFEHILCQNRDNPIIIDQFYCDHEKCEDHDSAVKVSDVKFVNVMGTSKRETAVKIECSKTVP